MDEVQSTLDGLKETMPSETYRKLCEVTKRTHDEEEEDEPLFEVAFTTTTVTADHYDPGEDSYIDTNNNLMITHTKQTKIMRLGGEHKTASFEKGLLRTNPRIGDVLEPLIKPGDQLTKKLWPNSTDGFSHSHQSQCVLYTIIAVTQYKPKSKRKA